MGYNSGGFTKSTYFRALKETQKYYIINLLDKLQFEGGIIMPTGINILSTILSIFYIIVFLLGVVNAVAPKWCWKISESWKATQEPSKTYFLIRRISGVIIMIVIAIIALAPTLVAYFDK